MVIFKCVILGRPISKKNSLQMAVNKKTGKTFPVQSEAYKKYEKKAKQELAGKQTVPVNFPVNVQCTYFMPTKHRVDLCNLLAATCDVLVKYGIIEDDNSSIVAGHDGSRVLYDKENPRTEITISRF